MTIDERNLPKLSESEMLAEPRATWLRVEHDILRDWSGRVKQMLQFDGVNGGRWIYGTPVPGWLTLERVRELTALDVPVGQLFWARRLLRWAEGEA